MMEVIARARCGCAVQQQATVDLDHSRPFHDIKSRSQCARVKMALHFLQSTRWTTVLSVSLNLCFLVLVSCLLVLNQFSRSTFSKERVPACQCAHAPWPERISKINQTELKQEHHLPKTENKTKPYPVQEHHMLAVAVMSAPGNVDRRNAIRKTWKRGYKRGIHYVKFVIGIKGQSAKFVQFLEKENSKQKDMVLLTHIQDSYKILPYKVLASMAWFDRNVNYSYLLKTDDDCFVMLDRMEDELRKRDHSRGLYWGWFFPAGNVEREGKWAEPKWKFCDKYFPYAGGGGYVLSADVIHRIVSLADSLIVYNSEDVSVGAWTVVYDIERKHDVRFNSQEKLRGCRNTNLILHLGNYSTKYIVDTDRRYRGSKRLCEQEIRKVEFNYDWSRLPSKAYVRKLSYP